MKKIVSVLLSVLLMVAVTSIALARSAPPGQKIVVQSVPPMTTGYDVICNLSTTQTTAPRGLSATVDWRSVKPGNLHQATSTPAVVPLE